LKAADLPRAEGTEAPPRRNGELLFQAPWESRAFGLAVTLHEAGVFAWEEFRRRLIAEIAAWETSHEDGAEYEYYRLWLRALERTLTDRGLCTAAELQDRLTELAKRPHGHDHPPAASSSPKPDEKRESARAP
jgi:nitrile hydratase accessory protein